MELRILGNRKILSTLLLAVSTVFLPSDLATLNTKLQQAASGQNGERAMHKVGDQTIFAASQRAAEIFLKTSYTASYKNFPNPERGFRIGSHTINLSSPFSKSEIQSSLSSKLTVIYRIYTLSDFRNRPLSQEFLDFLVRDFSVARSGGVKLAVRFNYNSGMNEPDAPLSRVLSHIEQLKPVLQANFDVISHLDAGFIGAWGEWHSSTNGLDNPTNRNKILKAILAALPKQRMIAVRSLEYKTDAFGIEEPLSPTEAFNGTNRARVGAYNDCFLASDDDFGTYESNPKIQEEQKTFLSLDNRFVVQGGETCKHNPPRSSCPTALKELARMHWSQLNYEYHEAVLSGWKNQGCMPEIERRLGYRFRLIDSEIPERVRPGAKFTMKFHITNDGWTSPFNPRLVEIILRNSQTGSKYRIPVNEDPRFWLAGETHQVNINFTLPKDIPSGEYDVFLNLPDPAPQLYGHPKYSIRLANQNVWEGATGYNSLLRKVKVVSIK
jgi:hypothetical protein